MSLPPETNVISTLFESVPDTTQESTPVVAAHESKINAPSSVVQLESVQPRNTVVVLNSLTAAGVLEVPRVLLFCRNSARLTVSFSTRTSEGGFCPLSGSMSSAALTWVAASARAASKPTVAASSKMK